MPRPIGRFEILERIGEGGMAVVYKAHDRRMNQVVALKCLKDSLNSAEMRTRFVEEARSAGRLRNPHIVTTFELCQDRREPCIVMEFLDGRSLDHLIKQRAPLSLLRKLELMEALCAGLGYAHRQCVVHRDIKPSNLIVGPDGVLKILDFGIARAGASKPARIEHQVGTYPYMAPEQIRGDSVDQRSDVFAVGAVFYEILAYQRAFPVVKGKSIAHTLGREPVPLAELCPGLAPEIGAIVTKALQKAPADRYQEIFDMGLDIAGARKALHSCANPPNGRY